MTLKKRRIVLVLCITVFLFAIPPILLYVNGYMIDFNFNLYKTGGLDVSSPFIGSKIFINNKEKIETNFLQRGIFLQSLRPETYFAMVAKNNYWPWFKSLRVKEQTVTKARAMLIPKDPEGKIVFRSNFTSTEKTDYEKIFENLKKCQTVTITVCQNFQKNSPDDLEKIFVNVKTNQIFAEWLGNKNSLPYFFCDDNLCSEKIIIFNSKFFVKKIDFYPERDDVLIAAIQNGVYAIEFDGRGEQRTMLPIYKGKDPSFFIDPKNEGLIYILDGDDLMEIKLE